MKKRSRRAAACSASGAHTDAATADIGYPKKWRKEGHFKAVLHALNDSALDETQVVLVGAINLKTDGSREAVYAYGARIDTKVGNTGGVGFGIVGHANTRSRGADTAP